MSILFIVGMMIVVVFAVFLVVIFLLVLRMIRNGDFKAKYEEFVKDRANDKELKKQEKQALKSAHAEARLQAIEESKEDLVELYKKKQKDKITGQDKKNKMDKLAKAFSMGGSGSFGSGSNIFNDESKQRNQKEEQERILNFLK